MTPQASPPALLLSSADIRSLMKPADWFRAVEAGFLASKQGRTLSPAPMHIPVPGGGFHAKGAYLAAAGASNRGYVALKLNGNLPGNPGRTGLPTIQGAVLLCDAGTGSVLAILDSIEVTLMRTAAASAVAASRLAKKSSRTMLVCGCGQQAMPHIAALMDVLPVRTVFVSDIDAGKAEAFARSARSELGMPVEAVSCFADVSARCDVIVTCTTSTVAFLGAEHLSPGAFVAAVGADSSGKSEIAPDLMEQAKVVVDVLDQCLAMGDLRLALASSALSSSDVHADLGDIVSGARPGRENDDEIIVFDSTGTAIEDVASSAMIYELACEYGAGLRVSLTSEQ
jgi:ornithine cyclodeaminase/alanine dehydrogenase-like protein (mu-crystallin family)